jgi:carboxypeptidase C (cathepsin A)
MTLANISHVAMVRQSQLTTNQGIIMKVKCLLSLCTITFSLFSTEPQLPPEAICTPSQRFTNFSTTSHEYAIDGKECSYTATAGTLQIQNDENQDIASLFFTAYFKNPNVTYKTNRPLCFCFNGGPGSSSVWLHMGFGPKSPVLSPANYTKAPSTYTNNPYTLLADVDLVFVDPVSTGFSEAIPLNSASKFNGINEDIDCFARFIKTFLTQFKRWDSPKYIMGESYGTLRAVGLADKLHKSHFIDINGLILISMTLDLQTANLIGTNDLSHALTLPTMAATAWHHKRLNPKLQEKPLSELLSEVESFALHEYSTALLLGNKLSDERFDLIAQKLASYTGLDLKSIKASLLRIENSKFVKELLRNDYKVVGHFDSRYVGYESSSQATTTHIDPSFDAVLGPFTASFQQYLSKELKIDRDRSYHILNLTAVYPWDFGGQRLPAGLGYLDLSHKLVSAIEKNPSLKVFVASGYYDFATPYFAADHTLSHLQLVPQLFQNITSVQYESGHMIYINPEAHKKMQGDLKAFFARN